MRHRIDRRRFLASAAVATLPGLGSYKPAYAENGRVAKPGTPRLRLAVKYAMIRPRTDATVLEKFELVKKIGFEGLEIQAPGEVDVDEAIAASRATGIKIHGVIDAVHWKIRLSDPSADVRAQALSVLKEAIVTAGRVGADTVLLVPGKVNDPKHENWDQVWERSQAAVRACLKDAEAAHVVIAIETVGNDFITRPEHLIRYVDELDSPHVGAYFDCSNMLRHGVSSADWIRRLGRRMVKFDFKGYSVAKGAQTKIGEGDENWPEVLTALAEVGYDGWATSEVSGGDEAELTDIYRRMAKALRKA